MVHEKSHKGQKFDDDLTLAFGKCKGRREVGPKGVPKVIVPFNPEGDNIDLFPEGFLYERGCDIRRGASHTLTTPKDRVIEIKMWGTLPYITKDDLHKCITDLPEHTVPGRSGLVTQLPTAARVCRNAVSMSETRASLKHLLTDMSKPQFNNVISKYKNLPDVYYGGETAKVVTPDLLDRHFAEQSGGKAVSNVKMWEWYGGSCSLSRNAKDSEVPHHPPIDYRHGWNLSKKEHQLKLLKGLLSHGTDCLFASPNCAPWGNDSRAVTAEKREERRTKETSTLAFLAVACVFQILLDRKYIVENSAYSDIFAKSPLEILRQLPFFLALFDQCSCGPSLNGEHVRKRSHFQSSHVFHFLQQLCSGGHDHLHLRGGGLAASAALYPDEECKRILQEAQLPADACKGGRSLLSDGTSVSKFVRMSWDEQLGTLHSIAKEKGLTKVWNQFVQPWLKANSTGERTLQAPLPFPYDDDAHWAYRKDKSDFGPAPVTSTAAAVGEPWQHRMPPITASVVGERPADADDWVEDIMFDIQDANPVPTAAPEVLKTKGVKDLVTSFDKDKAPWQYKKYSAENSLWQGAALRRRAHPRRSNVSLGVCACDLSGPHVATPRPGKLTHKNPCFYFLVLTVRPDMTAETCDAGTQYERNPTSGTGSSDSLPTKKAKGALVYAALLGTKDDATEAIKQLLVQINNDHANYPTEIIFRFHSDQGGEFTSHDLRKFLIEKGIMPTTTAGYDPNANPAEAFVGILKRRARYLLGGCRLPINWWGVAILAAAQLCRADAGLEEYPAVPFGTRVMVVKEPPPRSAFMLRADPATIFGPCEGVSGASWTYQHGLVKARTNIQPQGMSDDDLTWVKVNMSDWDAPDAPTPIPPIELYDATTLAPVAPMPDGATRETATCPHCICARRKHRSDSPHTLVWGECLKATPPPPVVEAPLLEVEPLPNMCEPIVEEEVEELQEALVASVSVHLPPSSSHHKLLECPHACVAYSDVATWGSPSSV